MSLNRQQASRAAASVLLGMTITLLAHAGGSVSWIHIVANAPPARQMHAMCTDSDRRRIVLFGGLSSTTLGDTWEWDGSRWNRMHPAGATPPPRCMHAMAYDAQRHVTILFGGLDAGDHPLNDTWSWDGVRWLRLPAGGPSMFGHAMAYDAARRRIVLFGGFEKHEDSYDDQTSDDTWLWNGTTWNKVSSRGPDGRWRHAMAYDAARQRVLLIGGETRYFDAYPGSITGHEGDWVNDLLSDFWEWNGQKWSIRSNHQIEPVIGHAMAWDDAQQRVVMFGGRNDDQTFRQTRDCSSGTLTAIDNHGPAARYGHAMAFDPVAQRVLMFGGRSSRLWKDTWELGP